MRLVVLALLAACNQFYGLDQTRVRIDASAADGDGDGVSDVIDNCITTPNPTQADEDRDGHGNACDNCPLIGNPDQQDLGDGDGVGDRCDPHPVAAHDCLLLFDSFDDRDGFDAHWMKSAQGMGATTVLAEDGFVQMAAGVSTIVGLHALDDNAMPISGDVDVQAIASSTLSTDSGGGNVSGALFVGSQVSEARSGYWCGVSPTHVLTRETVGTLTQTTSSPLPSPPLGEDILVRLETTTVARTPALECLVEFGIALATNIPIGPPMQGALGAPGVMLSQAKAIVTGFTAYRNVGTSTTCPTPILR